jgi:serine/threonine protein kinase
MTAIQTKRICEGYEPIPGYVLEELLGRGGFGEVWRASAPGGIKKAVKFVFGAQDQKGALRELRSLERIKGVKHPFLLTLERFEAVENQLVIVTELADCSLEDEFKRRLKHGSCGITRDVLISYLHDAADALDYLHEQYQLQHLDIKPGNLLLVGGHVKVADFGLLKDLREVDCSAVDGLTPVYAPPEVFDGRPTMNSDQYSLAVMYQELLTGSRPFGGRTIAQLATQHVHSAPNLEPLPPSDRPIIARALEKNPDRRFDSCKEFVEALRARRGRASAVASFGHELSADDTESDSALTGRVPAVEDLPQLSNNEAAAGSGSGTNVLVVAIGGTGAQCIQELRRRSTEAGGETLDLHSVLIDTDRETIDSLNAVESPQSDSCCTVIHTPLRTAHEYRHRDTERLKTISRRWIYNVPRSGATEGMRPLGRLALVDHGRMVIERLDGAIEALAAAEGDGSPMVYVVGSLTGGTSSGMYLDVVHLLRHLMDQAGMEGVQILSLLSTASHKSDPARPLATLVTQAALKEMCHFLQAGNGYPGDAGANWPSVPAARTPLKNVYLISDAPADSAALPGIETISSYIWTDITGASELLAAARRLQTSEGTAIVPPSVRSVGVVPLSNEPRLQQSLLASAVVRNLLKSWLGVPTQERQNATPLADRVMRRIGLAPDAIIQATSHYLSQEQRVRPVLQAIARLPRHQQRDRVAVSAALAPVVESLIQESDLRSSVTGVVNHLQREMFVGLHDRRADVSSLVECLNTVHEKTIAAIGQLRRFDIAPPTSGEDAYRIFGDIAARLIAARQLELICGGLIWLKGRLARFAETLSQAIALVTKSQAGQEHHCRELLGRVRSEFESAVLRLHKASVDHFVVRFLTRQPSAADGSAMVHELTQSATPLLDQMVDLQASLGNDNLSERSTASADSKTEPEPQAASNDHPLSIEEALVAVKPSLLACGGLQRLLLVVGTEMERNQLEPAIRRINQGSLTVAMVPGATPKLIHEAQQIGLTDILSRLAILNGGNAQLTSRLASRTDIAW